MDRIKEFHKNLFNFRGKTSQSDYLFGLLYSLVVCFFVIMSVLALILTLNLGFIVLAIVVLGAGFFIVGLPMWAMVARRLNDAGLDFKYSLAVTALLVFLSIFNFSFITMLFLIVLIFIKADTINIK